MDSDRKKRVTHRSRFLQHANTTVVRTTRQTVQHCCKHTLTVHRQPEARVRVCTQSATSKRNQGKELSAIRPSTTRGRNRSGLGEFEKDQVLTGNARDVDLEAEIELVLLRGLLDLGRAAHLHTKTAARQDFRCSAATQQGNTSNARRSRLCGPCTACGLCFCCRRRCA
jgi:hypothetical protein